MRALAQWCGTATTAQRCEAAERLLCRLFDEGCYGPDGEGALLLLADDPSPRVRGLVAERLAREPAAPRGVVRLLCEDVDSVSVRLVSRSDALSEDDLIDLCATGSYAVQCALARRTRLPLRVAAALAEVGSRDAVMTLLQNDSAIVSPGTLRRLAHLHGEDGAMRDRLQRRADLPADIRHMLAMKTTASLAQSPFVENILGSSRARRVAVEAASDATGAIADELDAPSIPPFVEHLRREGQITSAFLVRLSCEGRIELFAACLSALGGVSPRRVRAILVDARSPAFKALCKRAGLPPEITTLLLATLRAWKSVSLGEASVEERHMPAYVIDQALSQIAADGGSQELRAILSRLSLSATRRQAVSQNERVAA